MNKEAKIFVAGHRGLVGSAIFKLLDSRGYHNLVVRTHKELDLTSQVETEAFFQKEKPEYVFLSAAKVGGIVANNVYRADFIYANLAIQNNVIHQSYVHGVKKLLFLGSTCIYPKNSPQPMKEEYLLTSSLEYTNEPYAMAKIVGIKMCESYNLQYGTNFISVMPTNLYGYNDNFDLEKSHVLPALIRKFHLGKALEDGDWKTIREDLDYMPIEGITGSNSDTEIIDILSKYGVQKEANDENNVSVEIWGTGSPKREFLWSEDLAEATVFLMENIDFKDTYAKDEKEIRNTHINIGTGEDISIKDLALTIKDIIGFNGSLKFNTSKPDGTMRKLTDSSKLHNLGWKHSVEMDEGISKVYESYLLTRTK